MQSSERSIHDVRFTALDGWRGLIACIIALCHLNVLGHLYGASILRNAYLLVDVFFVLSGFVISHAYLHRVRNTPQLATFIGKRFSRLWPLHAVMLAAFIACEAAKMFMLNGNALATESAPFQGHNSLSSIIPNIFLIHSLGIYDDYTWNIPSWALSVEFYTYIVFGIIVFTANFSRMRAPIILFLMTAVAGLSYFVMLRYSVRGIDTDVQYGLFRCIVDFGAGYISYLIWKQINRRKIGYHSGFIAFTLLEITSLVAFSAFVHFYGYTFYANLSPFAAALVILVFAFGKGMISRILSVAALQRLGRYSYCIYIIHVFVITNVLNRPIYFVEKLLDISLTSTVAAVGETIHVPTGKLIVLFNQWQADLLTFGYLVILVILAGIAYNCIELPCARYLNKLFERTPVSNKSVQDAVATASR